jgi:hypothetical protein
MFRLYKAIIRHHINEEFYPTEHFLKIFFSHGYSEDRKRKAHDT